MTCPQCGQEAKQVGKVFFCMTLDCPVCMVKGEEGEEGRGRMSHNGIGSHQSARMMKSEWLTPPEIIQALGPFNLDPRAPFFDDKSKWIQDIRNLIARVEMATTERPASAQESGDIKGKEV